MANLNDVIVIGGGPSGLRSARHLAENGLEVLVLEKKREIGEDILCTGIVGTELFERFDIPTDSLLNRMKKAKLVSPFGTSIEYEHPESFACVVDRKKFDQNLAADAFRAGATIKKSIKVTDVNVAPKEVKVTALSDSGSRVQYRGKVLVLATGVNYGLSKKLGLDFPREFLSGAQIELKTNRIPLPMIIVGRKISPGAFAWAVPSAGNKVRIGLITRHHPKQYLKKLIFDFFPHLIEEFDEGSIGQKLIAQGVLKKTHSDRVLAVGEAAAQVKTTTGGGLFYGILCSQIAAEVILKLFEKNSLKSSDLAVYDKLWRRVIEKEIRIGLFTRKICAGLNDNQIESLFQIARTDGILPLIKKKGNFDWHSSLIFALAKRVPVRSIKSILSLN
jgi:geranylgeranyl reductase family protein